MKRFTKEKLIEIIKECVGIKTAICERLGIGNQRTLNGYLDRWNLHDIIDEQKCRLNDKVRQNIVEMINERNEKVTLWYAERQMFDEFGNKQHIVNETKEPLKIVIEDPSIKEKIDKI